MGWVYQFWQADRKDEVNKSEKKIGADELPAVTQLFTEDYMVLFLLHNTLGAWWAGKILAARPALAASSDAQRFSNEGLFATHGADPYLQSHPMAVERTMHAQASAAISGPQAARERLPAFTG